MPRKIRAFKSVGFITTVLLLRLCTYVNTANAQNWDIDLLKRINPDKPDSKYWQYTSNSLYYLPATVSFSTLGYGILTGSGTARNRSYETLISIGLSTLIGETLKSVVQEERPSDKYPDIIFVNNTTTDLSFPSGHTLLAFTTATSLALEYKKWYITGPVFLWAGSVGYSRLYLGKHYPSDVLTGVALGILSGFVSHRFSVNVLKTYK